MTRAPRPRLRPTTSPPRKTAGSRWRACASPARSWPSRPLARYRPEEFRPGAQYQSDEDLTRLAGEIGTTIFHPVGTCKMGRDDDPLAVTDPHLHLRGVSGVRIADASVMPTITSGNTGSPTLMIAEKAALDGPRLMGLATRAACAPG